MRVVAVGGLVDERAARAVLEIARTQRAQRVLVFPGAAAAGMADAARNEVRALTDVYLDDAARWIMATLDGRAGADPPPTAPEGWIAAHVMEVRDQSNNGRRASPGAPQETAMALELIGPLVLIAVPDARRAIDARESAHIVVHGGAELVMDIAPGRATLCPGDIAKGGGVLLVDGPADPRVSVWSLDGMVLEARALPQQQSKLTVQGGHP